MPGYRTRPHSTGLSVTFIQPSSCLHLWWERSIHITAQTRQRGPGLESQLGQLPPLKRLGPAPPCSLGGMPSLPPPKGLPLLPLLPQKDGLGPWEGRGEKTEEDGGNGKEFPSRMEEQLKENCRDRHIPLVHVYTFGHKEE